MLLIDYAKQVVDKEKIKAIVQLNRLKITKVPDQGKSFTLVKHHTLISPLTFGDFIKKTVLMFAQGIV